VVFFAWLLSLTTLVHRCCSITSSFPQFSCSVVSNSLRPHELQHARPPCPSPTPGVHSDSRPWSQWCHPAISSSVHGIFQAKILEWVAISYSRGSSRPRDRTCVSCVSCIGRQVLYLWATWDSKTSVPIIYSVKDDIAAHWIGSKAPTLQGHFRFPSLTVTLINRIQVLFPPWGTCMSQGLQHQL